MGQIQIEGMEFYAHHGHYKEERIVGNTVVKYGFVLCQLFK